MSETASAGEVAEYLQKAVDRMAPVLAALEAANETTSAGEGRLPEETRAAALAADRFLVRLTRLYEKWERLQQRRDQYDLTRDTGDDLYATEDEERQ